MRCLLCKNATCKNKGDEKYEYAFIQSQNRSSNYNDFFKNLGIQDKNIFEQNITYNNFNVQGKMINLSKMEMKRNKSSDDFNKNNHKEVYFSNNNDKKNEPRRINASYDKNQNNPNKFNEIGRLNNNYHPIITGNNNLIKDNSKINNNINYGTSNEKIKMNDNTKPNNSLNFYTNNNKIYNRVVSTDKNNNNKNVLKKMTHEVNQKNNYFTKIDKNETSIILENKIKVKTNKKNEANNNYKKKYLIDDNDDLHNTTLEILKEKILKNEHNNNNNKTKNEKDNKTNNNNGNNNYVDTNNKDYDNNKNINNNNIYNNYNNKNNYNTNNNIIISKNNLRYYNLDKGNNRYHNNNINEKNINCISANNKIENNINKNDNLYNINFTSLKISKLETNLNNKNKNMQKINNINAINDKTKESTTLSMSSSNPNSSQYQNDINSFSTDSISLLYLTLKCLANIKHLTRFLLDQTNIQKINSDKNKHKLTIVYAEIINNFFFKDSNNLNNPILNFKNAILQKNPSIFGKNDSNPINLILYIIETIHLELNLSKNNIQIIQAQTPNSSQYDFQSTFKSKIQYFKDNYNSIISNLFYGSSNLKMQCQNCKFISHDIQFYNNLTFSLDEVYSLKKKNNNNIVDIIECFEYSKKLDYIECQNCPICNKKFNFLSQKVLITSPNVLIINLERKGMQSFIKLNFGEYLDISNFIFFKNQYHKKYELIGIISYETQNVNKHYFSFGKSSNDNLWYKYNNNSSQPSSFQEASNEGNPNILIYSIV